MILKTTEAICSKRKTEVFPKINLNLEVVMNFIDCMKITNTIKDLLVQNCTSPSKRKYGIKVCHQILSTRR
jgi:regulator of sigma D